MLGLPGREWFGLELLALQKSRVVGLGGVSKAPRALLVKEALIVRVRGMEAWVTT